MDLIMANLEFEPFGNASGRGARPGFVWFGLGPKGSTLHGIFPDTILRYP